MPRRRSGSTGCERSSMKLSEAGELGILHELESRGLIQGTQHDAAELADGVVVTQDALVEGVHFRLDWLSWRELGFRAAAVNISDLAASAARPEALLVTLAAPPDVHVEQVVELYKGIVAAGVPVRGGDTTRANGIVVSVTAVVTGPLGAAGAAFRQGGYLRPPIRIEEGLRLGSVASAMLDVSDGLAVDAGHIARPSGCRLLIDLDSVPLAGTLDDLGFGEDFELLATTADALDFTVVGRCEEGEGVLLLRSGEPYALRGYEHFTAGE